MLVLLSPAKTLDFSRNVPENMVASLPDCSQEAWELVQILRKYSKEELSDLMGISSKLSELNYHRFQNFSHQYEQYKSKPAIYAYNGDVYAQLELSEYNEDQIKYANEVLRIISGLYGLLKPLDLIQPYRLEMSVALHNVCGKTLYDFWNLLITNKINEHIAKQQVSFLINLASHEYSSTIYVDQLDKPMINIVFKERQEDGYKIVGIHAKKARGAMANFIVRNFIKNPMQLKTINLNGYQFMEKLSSEGEYVFVR